MQEFHNCPIFKAFIVTILLKYSYYTKGTINKSMQDLDCNEQNQIPPQLAEYGIGKENTCNML